VAVGGGAAVGEEVALGVAVVGCGASVGVLAASVGVCALRVAVGVASGSVVGRRSVAAGGSADAMPFDGSTSVGGAKLGTELVTDAVEVAPLPVGPHPAIARARMIATSDKTVPLVPN